MSKSNNNDTSNTEQKLSEIEKNISLISLKLQILDQEIRDITEFALVNKMRMFDMARIFYKLDEKFKFDQYFDEETDLSNEMPDHFFETFSNAELDDMSYDEFKDLYFEKYFPREEDIALCSKKDQKLIRDEKDQVEAMFELIYREKVNHEFSKYCLSLEDYREKRFEITCPHCNAPTTIDIEKYLYGKNNYCINCSKTINSKSCLKEIDQIRLINFLGEDAKNLDIKKESKSTKTKKSSTNTINFDDYKDRNSKSSTKNTNNKK